MPTQPITLVLMPGLDGTGDLFDDFADALPRNSKKVIVRYPPGKFLGYAELLHLIRQVAPQDGPFALVAESFSTPLAIQFAAYKPVNLRALVLSTGFATSPVSGPIKAAVRLLAPVLFRLPLPDFATRSYLAGKSASPELIESIRTAIKSVSPNVLTRRLNAVLSCDALMELPAVEVPILYIQAAQDRLVPTSALNQLLGLKPGIKTIRTDGPHLLLQRYPEETAHIITAFLQLLP